MATITEIIEKEPTTMADFIDWDPPVDGYKYEWNDGQLIKFKKKKHLKIMRIRG